MPAPWRTRPFGKRKQRGVMNSTEEKFLEQYIKPRVDEGKVSDWWYEAWSWKLTEKTPGGNGSKSKPGIRYTPDFVCMLASGELVLFEVKGTGNARIQDLNRVKLFADKFPLRIYVATQRRVKDGGGFHVVEY